jgi:hypothetical protein
MLKNNEVEYKYGFGILLLTLMLNFANILKGGLNPMVSHSRDGIRNKMMSLDVCKLFCIWSLTINIPPFIDTFTWILKTLREYFKVCVRDKEARARV